MRILLAEDDPTLCGTLQASMERSGHPVVAVGDGATAWRALASTHFDLAILDWKLPEMDGLELARRIRQASGTETYVLVITGHDDQLTRDALEHSGADAYLAKPLSSRVLEKQLALVERYLEREAARKGRMEGLARSEARLSLLIHQAPIALMESDAEGRLLVWNPAAEQIFGYPESEVLGQPCLRYLLPPAEQEDLEARWRDLLRLRGITQCTRPSRTKEGREIMCSWYHTPLLGPGGEVLGLVALAEDITARIQEEDATHRAQKLEFLETLAGGFAQDFSNLITAITGSAELAHAGLPPASEAERPLDQILAAAAKAARLCGQLLTYSGKARFTLAPLDLTALVRESLAEMRIALPGRGLELHAADVPLGVEGDRAPLKQALTDLVRNAHEVMDRLDGPIVLRTGLLRADARLLASAHGGVGLPEGDYAWVEVRDAGPGVDPHLEERIFDPFFSTKFPGRGLGLAAVLGVARAHHGAVLVESTPGRGSAFRLLLPISHRAIPERPVPRVPRQLPDDAPRILLVDDEELTRTVIADALGHLGFRTWEAANGREAVECYRAHPGEIDAVLMDLSMPEMDGGQAFEAIRAIHPEARVLLMSAYSEQEATARYVGMGLAAFIPKPFRMADLDQQLRAVLAKG